MVYKLLFYIFLLSYSVVNLNATGYLNTYKFPQAKGCLSEFILYFAYFNLRLLWLGIDVWQNTLPSKSRNIALNILTWYHYYNVFLDIIILIMLFYFRYALFYYTTIYNSEKIHFRINIRTRDGGFCMMASIRSSN